MDKKFLSEVGEQTLGKLEKKSYEILAIVLMTIPVALSFQQFISGKQVLSIAPTLLSTLYAAILHMIVGVRGIRNYFENYIGILMDGLNILFTASFISIFISNETLTIPFINQPISSQVLVMLAILLSLISMRAIAGYIWIILAILSIFRLAGINEAMGTWGVAYMLCAFLSLGIQVFKLKLVSIDKNELAYEFRGASNRILGDINSSAMQIKSSIKTVENQIGKIKESYDNNSKTLKQEDFIKKYRIE